MIPPVKAFSSISCCSSFAAVKPKDALVNLIRRARPVFLHCVHANTQADVPGLRAQLRSTQILSALQFHRTGEPGCTHTFARRRRRRVMMLGSDHSRNNTSLFLSGYPEHMTLSDFRCHFQALSPPIMKRYASMFVSHDERKVGGGGASPPPRLTARLGPPKLTSRFAFQAVEELLTDLDLEKKSVVVGDSRVRPPLVGACECSGRGVMARRSSCGYLRCS